MEAWLIYFRDGAEYNKEYIRFYKEEGNKLGVNIRLILIEELEFGVKEGQLFLRLNNETMKNQISARPSFVILRAIYPLLSRHLELMGLKVFNSSFVSEICNDKARTCQYLADTGIKLVDTSFYRGFQAEKIIAAAKPQTVVKAVDGHGGSQVFLISDEIRNGFEEAKDDIDRNSTVAEMKVKLMGSDFILQPLTGSKHQDLRVYVIGKEIIAAVLRTSREGFRSNYSLGGEVALYHLNREEKGIVDQIIAKFDFGLVGIDFIIGDDNELILNEIEDVVGARMLYQCSDINIVKRYLEYIITSLS